MASPQPGVWGIDLGQCALKAVRLESIDGTVTATAFDYVEHAKILSQPDADPDQLTREALEKFLSRNNLTGDVVGISVPGQSGLARFVKLPPVEEKKITDIVRFEAKQQIPFNLDEVVWDYQKIGSGVVTDGFAMETEIGLFAIKRDVVSRALQPFQEVGIEVGLVQMAPLALCNYTSFDLLGKEGLPTEGEDEGGKKQCVVALDIGVETSNLVITDGERIIWQRPIPIGGNRFTRALTKELKLTFAKAEHLKKNATKAKDHLRSILQALKNDLNEFVNEVQKSLNFFASTHRDAQIQYMMGLGNAFKLPGLQKYLQEKLQLEVRKLQKFERLDGESVVTAPVFADNILSFATAYGLAVQGLKLSRLQTNLLPHEIRMERLIRAKKPWAVAAAAALLVGVAGLTFGYKLERDAIASPLIKEAQEKAGEPALKEVAAAETRVRTKQADYKRLEDSVKAIIAGQEERNNWLEINKFINDALPRPDGSNLNDRQKATYWSKGGDEAYKKYAARQAAGGGDNDTEGLDKLIQVNLEAVNSLYTDDLSGYFSRLQASNKHLFGMSEHDKSHPPKGREAGWVVELRGYTYNDAQHQFVLDTLVDNLTARGSRAPGAAPGATATGKGAKADPVVGRVSHVLLYRFKPEENAKGPRFQLIDSSVLPNLVSNLNLSADKPGTTPPGQPRQPLAAGGRSRDGWRPLSSDAGRFGQGGDRIVQATIPDDPKVSKVDVKKGQHVRTEFIVLLIWREPVPSDLVEGGDALPSGTPPPKGPNTPGQVQPKGPKTE